MPELPEVESLRRGLEKVLLGQKIKRVEVLAPKLVSGKGNLRAVSARKTREFVGGLEGKKILSIQRRAKNLIFHLSGRGVMIVHLKMTGQLVYMGKKTGGGRLKVVNTEKIIGGHPIELSETKLPHRHTRLIFHLVGGTLYYNDVRMFGYLLYYPNLEKAEAEGHFSGLGVEPTGKTFTLGYFREHLKKRTGSLKKVLMDQKVVTGLGNIYADEVAHAAGVRPMRAIKSLSRREIEKIYLTIRHILPEAIRLGGSSVANYLLADGSRGNYAREHKVYGKSGSACGGCGKKLVTLALNGRTTVYCPGCQK